MLQSEEEKLKIQTENDVKHNCGENIYLRVVSLPGWGMGRWVGLQSVRTPIATRLRDERTGYCIRFYVCVTVSLVDS